ncbi:MAG: Dabb family protein [Zavarzinella sp.]
MLLCHNVYFSLLERSPENVAALIQACEKYLTIQPGIVAFFCGGLDHDLRREVNDLDFDVALHIVFLDRAAHDAYQVDPTHNQFISENKATWKKVRVFDSLVRQMKPTASLTVE